MQTLIRYSVINQDGRAVIRAVPVRRRVGAPPAAVPVPRDRTPRAHSLRRAFRRFRAVRDAGMAAC